MDLMIAFIHNIYMIDVSYPFIFFIQNLINIRINLTYYIFNNFHKYHHFFLIVFIKSAVGIFFIF